MSFPQLAFVSCRYVSLCFVMLGKILVIKLRYFLDIFVISIDKYLALILDDNFIALVSCRATLK